MGTESKHYPFLPIHTPSFAHRHLVSLTFLTFVTLSRGLWHVEFTRVDLTLFPTHECVRFLFTLSTNKKKEFFIFHFFRIVLRMCDCCSSRPNREACCFFFHFRSVMIRFSYRLNELTTRLAVSSCFIFPRDQRYGEGGPVLAGATRLNSSIHFFHACLLYTYIILYLFFFVYFLISFFYFSFI